MKIWYYRIVTKDLEGCLKENAVYSPFRKSLNSQSEKPAKEVEIIRQESQNYYQTLISEMAAIARSRKRDLEALGVSPKTATNEQLADIVAKLGWNKSIAEEYCYYLRNYFVPLYSHSNLGKDGKRDFILLGFEIPEAISKESSLSGYLLVWWELSLEHLKHIKAVQWKFQGITALLEKYGKNDVEVRLFNIHPSF